ncbi:MAG: hypothetical protein HY320_04195 [Armatimonadetes bacterium]|nr:hypothetical protein [Armatimonadota bacterium]
MASLELMTMRAVSARLRLPRHRIRQLVRQGGCPPLAGVSLVPTASGFFPAPQIQSLREGEVQQWLASRRRRDRTTARRVSLGGQPP